MRTIKLIILFLLPFFVQAQQTGMPFVKNYGTKDYQASAVMWSVAQDGRGVMHFANNDGIFSYDGTRWKLTPTPSRARSVAVDEKGHIFVGCKGDFGTLRITRNGDHEYVSWKRMMPKNLQSEVFDILKIYPSKDAVYFISDQVIFKATKNGNLVNIEMIQAKSRIIGSGFVNNSIWVNISGQGLQQLSGKTFQAINGGSDFASKEISSIIKLNSGKYLIACYEGEMYLYSSGFSKLPALDILKKNKIYETTAFTDGSFAVATLFGGAVVCNASGAEIATFNKSNGLLDNDMYSIFVDNQQGLWLGHAKGISRVMINQSFRNLATVPGLSGNISNLLRYKKQMFVATSQGVFKLKGNSFEKIAGLNTEVWSLKELNGKLLAASNLGVFDISSGTAVLVSDAPYAVDIFSLKSNPNVAYVVLQPGLVKLKFEDKWKEEIKFDKFKQELSSIAEDSDGSLYAGTLNSGLLKLNIGSDVQVQVIDTSKGLPLSSNKVFSGFGKLWIGTQFGVFEKQGDKYVKNESLSSMFVNGVPDFSTDAEGNLWLKGNSGTFKVIKNGDKYSLDSTVTHNLIQQKPTQTFVDQEEIWVAYQDILTYGKNEEPIAANFKTLIRKVIVGQDSIYFAGNYTSTDGNSLVFTQTEALTPSLPYQFNTVSFEFSASSFDNENGNEFQYLLEGYKPDWSDWSNESKVTFTNLSEGKYTLKVRSKNSFGQLGEETTFTFAIQAPWFRTWWAILLYVVVGILVIFIVVRWNLNRLKAQNLLLEQQVLERTKEIAKQKKEIEHNLLEIQSAQNQLVQSEKMAALGQLVAGVAHEINTPIGAIRAAASNVNKSLPLTVQTMPSVLKLLNDDQMKLFSLMIERSLSFDGQLTSREERQFKKDMTTNLENAGVMNASAMATDLVKIGLFEKYDEFMPIFKHDKAKEIVDLIGSLGKLRVNLTNIDTAVTKTQKIVFALKSYSHKSIDEKPEPVNIIDNIELVLTIYNNQLKYGMEVIKNMDESVPMIMGLADELNQVWTNIIHNSIQAMENKGTITIDVFKENNMACIRLADNGPGIPEEYQKKIFEAFFTTKRQGEGSGLGLDICRKIIEKHNGTLDLEESRPGRTSFLIKLPITK